MTPAAAPLTVLFYVPNIYYYSVSKSEWEAEYWPGFPVTDSFRYQAASKRDDSKVT